MDPQQITEVGNIGQVLGEESLRGVTFVCQVVTGSSDGGGDDPLLSICSQLTERGFKPEETLLLLATVLKLLDYGKHAKKVLSTISLEDDDDPLTLETALGGDTISQEEYEKMRLRIFWVRLNKELGSSLMRSKFYRILCLMCGVNMANYSDSYKLFEYLESCGILHSDDSTGVVFILEALSTNKEFSKAIDFSKQFIREVWPGVSIDTLLLESSIKKSRSYVSNSIIKSSAKKLRQVYKNMPDIPTGDFFSPWPKVDRTRYVTLALVTNYGFTRDDDFTHRTLRKSEDDIPHHKYSVTYEEIFATDRSLNFQILISGRPGAGKTVLLTKVSKDWANEKCLTKVKALLHVSLRELASRSDRPQLEDIVSLCNVSKESTEAFIKIIEELNGEGVCFAMDGLDEYPNRTNSSDIVMRLIHKTYLPLSTVIITSRPTASHYVPSATRNYHVEIVGFMPEQIKEYVTDYYQSISEPHKADDLLRYLDSHPNVKDMCYLPLHLAMILYVNRYRDEANPLPETETGIYTRFITHSIVRYIRREIKDEDSQYANIRDFNDLDDWLSEEELALFHTICFVAFETKKKSRLIFGASYLKDNFPQQFGRRGERTKLTKNGLGIVSNYTKKVESGIEQQFSFQHLTIQEFLGAYSLSRLSKDECFTYIRSMGTSSDMREFWRFFFGLTKCNPSSVEYFREMVQVNPSQGSDTLFLTRCLFEIQGSPRSQESCEILLATRKGVVNVSNIVLNSPDCSAIGYVISQRPEDLKELVMNYCQVGPGGVQALNYQIMKAEAQFPNTWNMQIRSQFNPLGNEGGSPLYDILKQMPNLHQLRLYGNRLSNQKLLDLQPIITPMTNLRILVLTRNDLGPDSGSTISKILWDMKNLIQFYASYNPLGTEGLQNLLPGLCNCQNLQRLGFRDCKLASDSGKSLSEAISKLPNLQQLELYLNQLEDKGIEDMAESLKAAANLKQLSVTKNGITNKGGRLLADVVKATTSLVQIRLFYNEVSDETRKAFYDAAKYRLQQGLHEVRYAI